MKILLVDDSPADRALLQRLLKKCAATTAVQEAHTIANALRHLIQSKPDVVLLDYRMPGIADFEGLDLVRNIDTLIPVILISGFGDRRLGATALSAGADGYLQKDGLTAQALENTLTIAQGKSEARRRLAQEQRHREDIAQEISADRDHSNRTPHALLPGVTHNKAFEQNCDDLIKSAGGVTELMKKVAYFVRTGSKTDQQGLVDLEHLVAEAAATSRRLYGGTESTVTFGKLPIINSDRLLLQQIAENLISNGLKHNDHDNPNVFVSYAQQDRQHCLAFQDNGAGVAPQYRERIFKPFFRLTDQSGSMGAGMGLAISQRNAHRLGGGISVYTAPSGGSIFMLQFPAQ
ncbi:ATP-binding protein [Litorivivens sp.]|uniref:ATP-binding protein n=1 Tax=Litorivivens sp. TaxID=2020868 RepID=UPI003566597F